MIGNEICCLKNVGLIKLITATTHCQSLNSSQILPRSRQESDDLVSALLSLDLASENGKTLVSIGTYRTKEGWRDSAGQLISYFNWLPNEPENLGKKQIYAGFRIDGGNETAKWKGYSRTDKLNVVCTKTAGYGKNNSLLLTN